MDDLDETKRHLNREDAKSAKRCAKGNHKGTVFTNLAFFAASRFKCESNQADSSLSGTARDEQES